MLRTITGLFDSRGEAQAVVDHLIKHDKIDPSRVRLHGSDADAMGTSGADKGFWSSVKDLFVADEDRKVYAEGVRRGGVVVAAEVEESQLEHAMDVFEEHGAVDLDAREAEWRGSGWTGTETTTVGTVGDGTLVGMPGGTAGTAVGAMAATGTAATQPVAARASAPTGAGNLSAGNLTDGVVNVGNDEVLQVVEEQLRVGKRDAERGRVRVRSFITEIPVSEQVQLREERVSIERRPVDRPLTAADDAFRERSIEAVEHAEEAVVAKEARVVEELVIRKQATERTETVSDTVRRQDVEIEDDRTEVAARTAATPVRPKV